MLLPLLALSCSPSGLTDSAPPAEEEVDDPWLATVQSRIEAEALAFREGAPERFEARPGGFHAELGPEGLLATRGEDRVGIRLEAWGREGGLLPVDEATPAWGACQPGATPRVDGDCSRRVELEQPGLVEFWHASARGVEQGWEVFEEPVGDGLVVFELSVTEAIAWDIEPGERGAWLLGSDGGPWRYSGLEAWDAAGDPLDAWMEVREEGLRVVVDDAGALYPITVDPTLDDEIKVVASDGATNDYFGWSVSGAGDVDADGYDDVIVGAYGDDDNGSWSGSVYVYLGSSSGTDSSTEIKLTASDGATFDFFGSSVSGAGDVNGDGYDDVIVGAYYDADNGADSGSAYVYLGSRSGTRSGSQIKLTASDGASRDYFGYSVSGAGDVNGDGYHDVLVGAYGDGSSGSAYVYLGSSSGTDTSTEIKLTASDGAKADDFGWSVSGAGDVDGDGYDDVLVGAYRDDDNGSGSGSAYVYLGSSSGTDTSTEIKLTASDGAGGDKFAHSVSDAGDVDGDGYDDVIVGAYDDDDNGSSSGSAYVYLGSSAGTDTSTEIKLTASDGAESDYFGYSVSGAGDVDGDGYDDVIVGAPYNYYTYGAAYVYLGSSSGTDTSTQIKLTASVGGVTDYFGWSVSGAGDVDGDGYDAVLVGAYGDGGSGSIYVYTCKQSTWYADNDGDGYGDASSTTTACDQPSGTVNNSDDCDDSEPLAWTGNTEVCDGVDNDCDGTVDNDDAADADTWYADSDGDGYGDASSTTTACSQPSGFVDNTEDCDDSEPLAWTGNTEVCDGADNDCDGTVDNDDAADADTWYADSDGDGYGVASSTTTACSQPSGFVDNTEDCDDSEPLAWTGNAEVCDGADNDCDGTTDNDDAIDADTWYADGDGDGYGDAASTTIACDEPSGYVDNTDDCDDSEPLAWTGNTEVCDGVDNDCDGTVDNDDAADADTWYADSDGDSYGDATSTTTACSQPSGYVDNTDDCDDSEPLAWTGNTEVCDGADNDCDGTTDNDDAVDADTWYADSDADSYGDASSTTTACSQPSGYVDNTDDCDDGEPLAWTGNTEVCDGADNDCDGTVDNDDAIDADTWYADADGDGHGDPDSSTTACSQPSGFVDNTEDCDDGEPLAWTGNTEVCDGADNDCDGTVDNPSGPGAAADADTWYADTDGDGYGDASSTTTACSQPSGFVDNTEDCDDGEPLAWTGNTEVCDGADNDCDGSSDNAADAATWYADEDGDGYGDAGSTATACSQPSGYVDNANDCNDSERLAWTDAEEICGDGVDNDCDGVGGPHTDEDGDGLSWSDEQALGTEPCDGDSDGDGLSDGDERDLGTDPLDEDSDGDGLSDGEDPDPLTSEEVGDTGAAGGDKGGCSSSGGSSSLGLALLAGLALGRRRRGLGGVAS